jgi:2-isopropylmalate synthase
MIVDDTLREGLQMPGFALTKEEKLRLAELLSNAGINNAIVSYPSAHQSEYDLTKEIIKRNYFKTVFGLGRAIVEDINKIYETGANISLHLPFEIKNKEKIINAIKYASNLGKIVEVGLVNVTLYSENFLIGLAKEIENAGAERIQIADTLGNAFPSKIRQIISGIKSNLSAEVVVHLHNDSGLAITNAIYSLEAKVDFIDTTIFGIGERNGIVDTLIINNYLKNIGIDTGINESNLLLAYNYLENLIFKKIGYISFLNNYPIYGKNTDIQTAGTHAAFRNIFKEKNYSLNVYTGKNLVKKILEENGIFLSDEMIEYLTQKIKDLSVEYGKSFTKENLIEMVRDIYGKSD